MLVIRPKPRERTQTLSTVLDWLKAQRQTRLKILLAEHTSSKEGKMTLWNRQNFFIHQEALYLHLMPKGKTENLLLSVVPGAHCIAALNGCHWDAGHQGHDYTLSLLWEHFWWLGMTDHIQKSLKTCSHCLHHKGKSSTAPLHPIVSTAPMDLLHVDFTSINTTMEPNRLPKVAYMSWCSRTISWSALWHMWDSYQIFVSGLHLNLWSPWPGS